MTRFYCGSPSNITHPRIRCWVPCFPRSNTAPSTESNALLISAWLEELVLVQFASRPCLPAASNVSLFVLVPFRRRSLPLLASHVGPAGTCSRSPRLRCASATRQLLPSAFPRIACSIRELRCAPDPLRWPNILGIRYLRI